MDLNQQNQQARRAANTNANEVRARNQRSAQSPGGYQSYQNEFAAEPAAQQQQQQQAARNPQAANPQAANPLNANQEFASETNAQNVRAQNQQSMARKNQNQR